MHHQTPDLTNCGLAVTWMLRQLVLRLLGGQDLMDDLNQSRFNNDESGLDGAKERKLLSSIVSVMGACLSVMVSGD